MNKNVKTMWINKMVFLLLGLGVVSATAQATDKNGEVPNLIGKNDETANPKPLSKEEQEELYPLIENFFTGHFVPQCSFTEFLDSKSGIVIRNDWLSSLVRSNLDPYYKKKFSAAQIEVAFGQDRLKAVMTKLRDRVDELQKAGLDSLQDIKWMQAPGLHAFAEFKKGWGQTGKIAIENMSNATLAWRLEHGFSYREEYGYKIFSKVQILEGLEQGKFGDIRKSLTNKFHEVQKEILNRQDMSHLEGNEFHFINIVGGDGNIKKMSNSELAEKMLANQLHELIHYNNSYEKCMVTELQILEGLKQEELGNVKQALENRLMTLQKKKLERSFDWSFGDSDYVNNTISSKYIDFIDNNGEINKSNFVKMLRCFVEWHEYVEQNTHFFKSFPLPESKILEILEQGKLENIKEKIYTSVVVYYLEHLTISDLAEFVQEDGEVRCDVDKFAEVSWKRFFGTAPCTEANKKLLISKIQTHQQHYRLELEKRLRDRVQKVRELFRDNPEKVSYLFTAKDLARFLEKQNILKTLYKKNLLFKRVGKIMDIENDLEIKEISDLQRAWPPAWEKVFGKEEIQNLRANKEWAQKFKKGLQEELAIFRRKGCYFLIKNVVLYKMLCEKPSVLFSKFWTSDGTLKDTKFISFRLWKAVMKSMASGWRKIIPMQILYEYLQLPKNKKYFETIMTNRKTALQKTFVDY